MNKILAWTFAIILTFVAAIYQRKTGPTYPTKEQITVNGKEYKFNLLRSNGQRDAMVEIPFAEGFTGAVTYKRYPTNDDWTTVPLKQVDSALIVALPMQPPAGKLEYYVTLNYDNEVVFENSDAPVVMRFKGDVPAYILIPHIFFMFFAMLLSNLAGILAVFKDDAQKKYGFITLIFLIIGGAILGPIVQKFAFGELWTGIPFGWDLTDNKTLFALIGWIIAIVLNRKKQRPYLTVIASVLLIIVFSIPHSMFGSQLDPDTGKVIQGTVLNFFTLLY